MTTRSLCRGCDDTGWMSYHSETVDGEFEEAYRLCSNCYAPRYCMGSKADHSCTRPGTGRCGLGCYCEEHAGVVRNGGIWEAHRREGCESGALTEEC